MQNKTQEKEYVFEEYGTATYRYVVSANNYEEAKQIFFNENIYTAELINFHDSMWECVQGKENDNESN